MGDRTSVVLEISPSDAKRLEALDIEGDEDDEMGTIVFYEENYGGSYISDKLKEAGIPFILSWGSGGEYDPGSSAFDGKNFFEVSCFCGGRTAVGCDDAGNPLAEEVRAARRYARVEKRLRRRFQRERDLLNAGPVGELVLQVEKKTSRKGGS